MKKHILKTGLKELDSIVGNVWEGDLVVIASRPGMGKSSLAIQILVKNCKEKKCVYLSNDNDIGEIILRAEYLLGSLDGRESEREIFEYSRQIIERKLNDTLHFFTDDEDFFSFCLELAKIKAEKGLDFVFIDGFQLLKTTTPPDILAEWLKRLAKALGIVVFVTTQVSRKFYDYQRIDCRTINGSLYYIADKILGIYRKDAFASMEELASGVVKKGESYLAVVKNNRGKLGKTIAYFDCKRFAFCEELCPEL